MIQSFVRNCQGCGSIQRAEIQCPLCGHATGPKPPVGPHNESLACVIQAEWASGPRRPAITSDPGALIRAKIRRLVWRAARLKQGSAMGGAGLNSMPAMVLYLGFLEEELALIAAGVGPGVVP